MLAGNAGQDDDAGFVDLDALPDDFLGDVGGDLDLGDDDYSEGRPSIGDLSTASASTDTLNAFNQICNSKEPDLLSEGKL
jgi:hypothetical protein